MIMKFSYIVVLEVYLISSNFLHYLYYIISAYFCKIFLLSIFYGFFVRLNPFLS